MVIGGSGIWVSTNVCNAQPSFINELSKYLIVHLDSVINSFLLLVPYMVAKPIYIIKIEMNKCCYTIPPSQGKKILV